MPTSKPKEPSLQLTISLAEVTQLKEENASFKQKIAELETENDALKKQLHDLTDPAKQADYAAFRKHQGYKP